MQRGTPCHIDECMDPGGAVCAMLACEAVLCGDFYFKHAMSGMAVERNVDDDFVEGGVSVPLVMWAQKTRGLEGWI